MIKPPSAAVLYLLGLALEHGLCEDNDGDRPAFEWFNEQEQSPEYQAFIASYDAYLNRWPGRTATSPEAKADWEAIFKQHGG